MKYHNMNLMPVWLAWGLSLWLINGAHAQTPTDLDQVEFIGDIHHTLPANGGGNLLSDDDTIINFDLDTGTADGFINLGVLDSADIDAYHRGGDGCGATIYSVDASVEIAGTVMRPGDVFQSNGVKVLDAASESIPDGVNIDAISRDPDSCDLVFSVDVDTMLDGTAYSPSDLIAWNAVDGFSLFRTTGLRTNIDALHLLDIEDRVLISTDIDIEVLGSMFQDEDIIEIIPGGPGAFFELSFSPSPFDLSWEPADIDALWAMRAPVPGVFQWEAADIEVFEDDGSVSVMVVRTDGSEGSVDIAWTTIADTATAGADYTGTSDTLTLGDGILSGNIMVNLLDDGDIEGTEEFRILLTSVSGGSIGFPQEIRVIIRDDEDFIFADGYED